MNNRLTPLVSSPVIVTRWKSGTKSSFGRSVSTIEARWSRLERRRSRSISWSNGIAEDGFFVLSATQQSWLLETLAFPDLKRPGFGRLNVKNSHVILLWLEKTWSPQNYLPITDLRISHNIKQLYLLLRNYYALSLKKALSKEGVVRSWASNSTNVRDITQ